MLSGLLGLQLIALIPGGGAWKKIGSTLFLLGMAGVFFLSVFQMHIGAESIFSGAIQMDELFRLPRALIALVSLVLGSSVLASTALPSDRKPEILFMITALSLFGRVLLLSQNYLLSFLCLFGLAIPSIFLTGLSFRGPLEGEATLKWWYQSSVAVIFGFCAILLLQLLTGGLQYADIAHAIQGISTPRALLIVLLFLFPFFAVAGLFPLHFLSIDRDHGAPWSTQAICSILVSGVAALAMLKAGVAVYHDSETGRMPMRILESLGVIASFWCCIGSYTQLNAKRFLAFFSASQWSTLLLVVTKPTVLSLAASVYYFLGVSLALALIYPVMGSLHEFAGGDETSDTYGAGRRAGMAGVILLFGMCFFLFAPPLMGFPALFRILAAHFEQQSILRVLDFAVLQLLYAIIAVRLIANVFFRDAGERFTSAAAPYFYPKLSTLLGALVVAVTLVGGLFWDNIFVTLEAAAKNFVI